MEAKKNVHENHRKRMRRKFAENGFSGFADHEVLEMLLYGIYTRRDTNKIAHDLINECGGFYSVINAPVSELTLVDGVGEGAAQYIVMLREFMRFYTKKRMELENFDIRKQASREFLHELFADKNIEQFYLICLNKRKRVLMHKKLAEGDFGYVDINIKAIVKAAIEYQASEIIIAHNHPSGSIIASKEDEFSTTQIISAVHRMGIDLIDHYIVTDDCISSITANKVYNRDS